MKTYKGPLFSSHFVEFNSIPDRFFGGAGGSVDLPAAFRNPKDLRIMIQDAFTQADYAINITDQEGRLMQVNHAYLKLYKFASEEAVLGKTQRLIRSSQTPDSLYKDMWQTISDGHVWRGDLVKVQLATEAMFTFTLPFPRSDAIISLWVTWVFPWIVLNRSYWSANSCMPIN